MSHSLAGSQGREITIDIKEVRTGTEENQMNREMNQDANYSFVDHSVQFNFDTGTINHYYAGNKLRYEGGWKDGVPNGDGVMYNLDGEIEFKGNWKNGIFTVNSLCEYNYKENEMRVLYPNGQRRYQGNWKKGLPSGPGNYYDQNGSLLFKGNWEGGKLCITPPLYFEYESGLHILYNPSEQYIRYRGGVQETLLFRSGFGTTYYKNKQIEFEGEWRDDKYHGYGSFLNEVGNLVYQGYWKEDLPDGAGVYYENGHVKYEGTWIKGRLCIIGNKWFNYMNRTIETVVPLSTRRFTKRMNIISFDDIWDRKASFQQKLKYFGRIIGFLCIVFLVIYRFLLCCSTVTIYSYLDYLMVNPLVRELTFEIPFSSLGSNRILLIRNLPFLESIVIKDSFDKVMTFQLESIVRDAFL